MIESRLAHTRFPKGAQIQAQYWSRIGKLDISSPEQIIPGNSINPLRAGLLQATVPYLDLVLMTLPPNEIYSFKEGNKPAYVDRHHLGPVLMSKLPRILTMNTLITPDNLVHGGIANYDDLGSVAHLRLIGENERRLRSKPSISEVNSARRDDAIKLLEQDWLIDHVMESGIPRDQTMIFTRLVSAYIGFHLPHLVPTTIHPWLNQ